MMLLFQMIIVFQYFHVWFFVKRLWFNQLLITLLKQFYFLSKNRYFLECFNADWITFNFWAFLFWTLALISKLLKSLFNIFQVLFIIRIQISSSTICIISLCWRSQFRTLSLISSWLITFSHTSNLLMKLNFILISMTTRWKAFINLLYHWFIYSEQEIVLFNSLLS